MSKVNCNVFEVFESHRKQLFKYILRRVRSKQDAEDLLHEALFKMYQFCSKGKTVTHLKSWLFKITTNTIIDHYKRASAPVSTNLDSLEAEYTEASISGDASDYVRALTKRLPEKYATSLILYDLEGLPQKEVADFLGLGLRATKSRILRARLKLKEEFLRCCSIQLDGIGKLTHFEISPSCEGLEMEKARLEKTTDNIPHPFTDKQS